MARVRFFSAVLLFSLSVSLLFAATVGSSLIRIDGLSDSEIRGYFEKGYDIPRHGDDFVELVISPEEKAAGEFSKSGKVSVLIPDLDCYIGEILAGQTREASYYTFKTMTEQLKAWTQEYPDITVLKSIGKSCEGRDIWGLKLSDNPKKDEAEPAVLVMGAHHAREWPSFEVPMAVIKLLIEGYGKDEKLTRLVDTREIWFVPMVNPDGVEYSQNQSRYWRKNRRNIDGRNFGVDLNRNYGYQWGNVGASNSPSSDTYHGTGPFSEPEAQAIKKLAEREKFQASVSFHTYSELILYPFGYGYNIPCPDGATLKKLAGEMAGYNGYDPTNSAELYPAMGDSDDWLYGDQKTLAFTFELCRTFIPSASEISKFNALNVPAVIHLIDKSGTYAVTTPSGNAKLIENFDIQAALSAWTDLPELLADCSDDETRIRIEEKAELVAQKAAQLVEADVISGDDSSYRLTVSTPEAEYIRKLVDRKLLFDNLHENSAVPR